MAGKMRVLLITLACSTLSHATVLRWLGLTNNNEEIPVSYPPQTLPIQAPHVVLQTSADIHRPLNFRYVNSPLFNVGPPTPLSFLNFVQARNPVLPGPVLIGPPVGLVISNGQAVVGKPDNVEQGSVYSSGNSVQYLSQSSDQDGGLPIYVHETLPNRNYVNYPNREGQLHTAAELVRPVINSSLRPNFIVNSDSPIPQQYPIPSSDAYNHNNNNAYTPSSQPFLYPTYQQLPYPTSANDFSRPVYTSNPGLLPPPEPTANDAVQQEQRPLKASNTENFTNNVAFPLPNDEQIENVDQHSYELENGTKVSEQTNVVTSADGSNNQLVKSGEYEYIDDNGTLVKVKWIADENGFRIVP